MLQSGPILVTGATGAQGGAVVDALLAKGVAVRALVRDAGSAGALALAARSVDVVAGDFGDAASLARAVLGASGVFSVQLPSPASDPGAELRTGRHLVEAARRADVQVFVHTSVARAGDQLCFAGWAEGRWSADYWNGKSGVNDLVRAAGFRHWTILKPAFMMDNFIAPKSKGMFPALSRGAVETAMAQDTRLDLIAATDVGRFAAAAFADPARFDRQEIALAAEALTMDEVARALSEVAGKPVVARHRTEEEMVAAGANPGLASSQRWAAVEGYKVDIEALARWEIPLVRFADWVREHAARLEVAAYCS